ncbi:PQQ-binding-like beta-propeller repeat protein [Nocardia sp. NPDC056000]|uniref:outer membrane protein assembly factor BamB family protein n=1 Tax=Nocardia sp. NPDC056000 TaxID=3345674 RepID=UPI0035DD3ED4
MGGSTTSGWRDNASAVAGVGGAIAVATGFGLALYSRWGASRTTIEPEQLHRRTWFTEDVWGVDIATVPGVLTATALWLGAGLVIAVGVAALRIARGWDDYRGWGFLPALAVLATLAGWPILIVGDRVWQVWDQLRVEYPLSQQLPTALAAGTLNCIGAALLIPYLLHPHRFRLPTRVLAAVVVAAVLVCAGTAAAAVRAGDDRLHTDHVTAARAVIPPAPTRLGPEKYRFPIAALPGSRSATIGDLAPAGMGFVLSSPEGITAYDGATGEPRWHYLRTHTTKSGRSGVTYVDGSLRSLDHGAMILARWKSLGWIAFDAVTGEVLWQTSDFTRDAAGRTLQSSDSVQRPQLAVPGPWPAPIPLILNDDNRIQGYDARSGTRLWSTEVTVPECQSRNNTVVTDATVYRVASCSSDTESWIVATGLDARTGAIVATRELGRHSSTDRYDPYVRVRALTNTVVIDWATSDDGGHLLVRSPDQLATAPTIDRARWPIAADPGGPDVLYSDYWARAPRAPGRFTVSDTITGGERYALAGMDGWGEDAGHDAFLRDEIIETSYSAGSAVQAWSRDDGRWTQSQPIVTVSRDCVSTPIRVVPTAVVVVCIGKTTAELIGYTP